MASWEWIAVAVVAAGCVVPMAATIVRMFSRRGAAAGVSRKGTPAESGEYAATFPEGVRAFDAWAYRLTARFAGRVRVVVSPESVVVCGPRIGPGLYVAWIWTQGLLLAVVPAGLVWAALAWDWRVFASTLGVALLSWMVSMGGAGLWPGAGELAGVDDGLYPALESPRSAVRDVTVGRGWSHGGMALVLLPYVKAVDAMAAERAVSFDIPEEAGRIVRCSVHCPSDDAAAALSGMLRSGRSSD